MTDFLQRTWCEINLDRLQYNINQIQKTAGKEIIAVVKADAYGHGDTVVCRLLQREGIRWFAVSNISEAVRLREAGITGAILLLGYTPVSCASMLAKHRIIQAVYSRDYAHALNRAAEQAGVRITAHLKIDTGMGRIGFVEREDQSAAAEILALGEWKHLKFSGIFTHFSHADSGDPDAVDYTRLQMRRFERVVQELRAKGFRFTAVHAQNSAGISAYPDGLYTHARAGIILYGLPPSDTMKKDTGTKPLMQFKSVVSMVKAVNAGDCISYGRTFRADTKRRTATVAAGYADGYCRIFSSRASVLVQGVRCPVIGRVCMDQIVVDVTDVPSTVNPGDEVVLFGEQGDTSVTIDELAQIAGTINYEIVCGISHRVPRVYTSGGKVVECKDYLLDR